MWSHLGSVRACLSMSLQDISLRLSKHVPHYLALLGQLPLTCRPMNLSQWLLTQLLWTTLAPHQVEGPTCLALNISIHSTPSSQFLFYEILV